MIEVLKNNLFSKAFHWVHHNSIEMEQPLLNKDSIHNIKQLTEALPFSLFSFNHNTAFPQTGDILSEYKGRGYEFDDNRLYQPGDEMKLVNWRMYARTGDLYTKIFTEERKPGVFLIVDRQASMRFGTRNQLKTTLAAKLALAYLYQAQQHSYQVGGILINDKPEWFDTNSHGSSTRDLVDNLIKATPILTRHQSNTIDFSYYLQLILAKLPMGSFIVFLSDFHDLDETNDKILLHHLSLKHNIQAIQITDPSENTLPTNGNYLINNEHTIDPIHINNNDKDLHEKYTEEFTRRQQNIRNCFEQNNIPFTTLTTTIELEECLKLCHKSQIK